MWPKLSSCAELCPATESNLSNCEFAGLPAMRANSYLTSLENIRKTRPRSAYGFLSPRDFNMFRPTRTLFHTCNRHSLCSYRCSYRSLTQTAAMTDAHGQNASRAAPRTEPKDCGNSSIPTVPRNSFWINREKKNWEEQDMTTISYIPPDSNSTSHTCKP